MIKAAGVSRACVSRLIPEKFRVRINTANCVIINLDSSPPLYEILQSGERLFSFPPTRRFIASFALFLPAPVFSLARERGLILILDIKQSTQNGLTRLARLAQKEVIAFVKFKNTIGRRGSPRAHSVASVRRRTTSAFIARRSCSDLMESMFVFQRMRAAETR